MGGCPGFDKKDFALERFRSEVWQGFVFVTLDDGAESVAASLAELAPVLERYDAAELVPAIDLDWPCAFNWKLLAENFMEVYHHIGIHRTTLEPIMPAAGGTTEPGREAWVLLHIPYTDDYAAAANADGADLPAIDTLHPSERRELRIVHIYPTMLLTLFHDRIYWFRILPEGPRSFALKTVGLVPRATAAQEDFAAIVKTEEALLAMVHNDEDLAVCNGVARGLESARARPGRLNPLEAPMWEFQKYLARRLADPAGEDVRPAGDPR